MWSAGFSDCLTTKFYPDRSQGYCGGVWHCLPTFFRCLEVIVWWSQKEGIILQSLKISVSSISDLNQIFVQRIVRKPRVWRKVLVADRPIKYWIVLLSVSQFDSLGKQQIRPGIASQYRWGRRWSWALHDSFSTSLSSPSTWADTWPLQCQHLNKYGIYSAYIYICINNIYVYIYMYVCIYMYIYICISMDMGPIQRFQDYKSSSQLSWCQSIIKIFKITWTVPHCNPEPIGCLWCIPVRPTDGGRTSTLRCGEFRINPSYRKGPRDISLCTTQFWL